MLKDKIIEDIRAHGPLSIEQFMARALFDAEEGYYTTKHVFGRRGDFITSPEICQIFGEMIAVLLAGTMSAWREQQDKKIQLVELGPGRGTLMHDMLRTMQFMPHQARPDAVKMIEASENLQDQQKHLLAPFLPADNPDFITWHDSLGDLPGVPSIIVANEFFDALPIRQAIYKQGEWFERLIDVDDEKLVWSTAEQPLPPCGGADESKPIRRRSNRGGIDAETSPHSSAAHQQNVDASFACSPARGERNTEGDMYEWSDIAAETMQRLSARLAKHGGMAIIIDYGYTEHAFGDSLQAVKKHAYTNVLEDIGEVDITAHVNFAMLRDIALAAGLDVHTLTPQGNFLKSLGAEMRLSTLCQNAEPGQIIDLIKGLERLMSPVQMGELFKVLIVASKDVPVIHPWK